MINNQKKQIPLAFNFRKLQRYNPKFFSEAEIILFEFMLVLHHEFGGKEFYHSTSKIEAETCIKRTRQDRILKRFTELGILDITVKNMPPTKYFTLDCEAIWKLIPKIYKRKNEIGEKSELDAENETSHADIDEDIVDYYKLLVDTYQQEKKSKKKIKEETKVNSVGIDFFEGRLEGVPIAQEELPYSTDEFFSAWQAWLKYTMSKKRSPSSETLKTHLAILANCRTQRPAIAMIYNSIQKGYNGLFQVPHDQIELLIPKPTPKRKNCMDEDEYQYKCKNAGVKPEPLPDYIEFGSEWPYSDDSCFKSKKHVPELSKTITQVSELSDELPF